MSLSTTINVADYSPRPSHGIVCEECITSSVISDQITHSASIRSRSPLSESAAHAALLLAGAALLLAGVHGKRRLRAMHAASRARLT